MITKIQHPEPSRLRFLSLKWKALYLSCFLFIVLTMGFLITGKTYIDRQFVQDRDAANLQYQNQLSVLVEQSAAHLQQLAGTVLSFQNMEAAIVDDSIPMLRDAFDEHWWRFEIDGTVESAAFYRLDGSLMYVWGDSDFNAGVVAQVIANETPAWEVVCNVDCKIIAGVPLLVRGEFRTVVILSASFDNIILNFHAITDADIGIMHVEDGSANEQSWLRSILALTGMKHNRQILESFADINTEVPKLNRRVIYNNDHGNFELLFLPVTGANDSGENRLIVITDMSEELSGIANLYRNTFIAAILGLIASSLILLSILWQPTTDLQNMVEALPLLAENQFDAARKSFNARDNDKLITDESDVLKASALNLSYQLESLHSLLNNRAIQLEARGSELETEKNFVLSLLNTAHALILTQDSNGEILMINEHGERILGMASHDIIGRDFLSFMLEQDQQDVSEELSRLQSGIETEYKHEATVTSQHGGDRYVSWFHSSLPDTGDGEHHILTVGIDISERRTAEENLGWLANHDPLTGLVNRRYFESQLDQVVTTSERYSHSGALLFFDLDQFKDVNDSSGHQVGDELLMRVAEALTNTARESDLVARLGGDEFAIVIREADEFQAGEAADRFCRSLVEISVSGPRRIHRCSASIGVALFPQHGMTSTELLSNADVAMYQAKDAGRNTFSIFNEDAYGKEKIQARVYWNERVKDILANDTFELAYQPIVRLSDNSITHYEALLRVENESGELQGPVEFIAAAERGGLMPLMDEKVIGRALKEMQQLNKLGLKPRVAINLSGVSFRNENLADHIKSRLDEYEVDPYDVIFEITETAAMADVDLAISLMKDIRQYGCKFALDDFGVGLSSLHYLKRLSVDYLKIDGSFIRSLHERRDDRILVKAVCEIASEFGHLTVAEFVDCDEVVEILREIGVDFAQGFHLGEPKLANVQWPILDDKSVNS